MTSDLMLSLTQNRKKSMEEQQTKINTGAHHESGERTSPYGIKNHFCSSRARRWAHYGTVPTTGMQHFAHALYIAVTMWPSSITNVLPLGQLTAKGKIYPLIGGTPG